MPHDKNGQVLGEGDVVTLRARVTGITPGDRDDRVMLQVELTDPSDAQDDITVNARQVAIVEKAAPPARRGAKRRA